MMHVLAAGSCAGADPRLFIGLAQRHVALFAAAARVAGLRSLQCLGWSPPAPASEKILAFALASPDATLPCSPPPCAATRLSCCPTLPVYTSAGAIARVARLLPLLCPRSCRALLPSEEEERERENDVTARGEGKHVEIRKEEGKRKKKRKGKRKMEVKNK
jgi:hypothetical protein